MGRELCRGYGAIAALGATRAADRGGEKVASAEVWEDLRAGRVDGETGGGGGRRGGSEVGGVGGCPYRCVFVMIARVLWWMGGAATWCCAGLVGRTALDYVGGRTASADGEGEFRGPC